MSGLVRLNGPPLNNHHTTKRSTYAVLAFGTLVESVKSVVQSLFSTVLAFFCCFTSNKWNERAIHAYKSVLLFTAFFPVFIIGIAMPKVVDRIIS